MAAGADGRPPASGEKELAVGVLDRLLEGCQVVGRDFRYLYVNGAAAKQGQRRPEQLVGRTMMECYPGIEATPMFAVLCRSMNEGIPLRFDNEFDLPDGSKGWFELRFEPVQEGVCILSLDATEGRRAAAALAETEDQLRQAQKMEAVGRLAGGLAHDFNNILSVILSYSELMSAELPRDEPMRAHVDEIRNAGKRAAELTRQLLAFSRHQVLDARVLDLNRVVYGVDKMLRRLIGAGIELTFLPAHKLSCIRADAGQIEQILMNLTANARDAMPDGGRLTIQTDEVELDAEYARAHHGVTPGPYVLLAVTDTGAGMEKALVARIFEPFFTTKERGKGTGLGLATVFGIVKQSGGHIWVYSEPTHGTTFKLYFPRVDGTPESRMNETPSSAQIRGHETVLLVEDDEQVRRVARSVLRRHGYVVLEAPNAGQAILVAEQHRARIDLLLTDFVLPRMNGRQLAERIGKLRPRMKVLFMSGYTDEAAQQHGLLDSGVAYLEKPITPTTLAAKVREVLGEK